MKVEAQSIQSLMLSMRFDSTELSTGTGFIVETAIGPSLVTNRHNVTGKDQNTGEHLSSSLAEPNKIAIHHLQEHGSGTFNPVWIERIERLHRNDGSPRWIEHPTLGAKADFVLLPLEQTEGISLHPYDLEAGSNISVGPAETVSVIGFPFGKSAGGRFGIWATGFLASEPDIDYDQLPLLLIDCRTRPGQSGSPVIAFRTGSVPRVNGGVGISTGPTFRFIGIYSGRINKDSDIGIVWKAKAILALIKSLDPKPVRFNYGHFETVPMMHGCVPVESRILKKLP